MFNSLNYKVIQTHLQQEKIRALDIARKNTLNAFKNGTLKDYKQCQKDYETILNYYNNLGV